MEYRFLRNRIIRAGVLLNLMWVVGAASAMAQGCIGVKPANLQILFGSQAVGTQTAPQEIYITNNCTGPVVISSFTFGPSEFQLAEGWAPATLDPGKSQLFTVVFAPDSAQTFNGQFTVNFQSQNPIVVSLSGTGFVTGAVASLSSPSFTFSKIRAGSTSASQKEILTNTGTTEMTVLSVYSEPPFIVYGFNNSGPGVVLQAGQSLPLQVAFSPSAPGTYPGTLTITSDVLSPKGATLTGTAVAATRLSVTNYRILPAATQGFVYLATLAATGGVGNLSWSLATGAKLPTGLTLSSSGMISGTLPSALKLGNYVFKATVMDSNSPPDIATARFTLPVSGPTGASCNNISWDVTGTNTPIVPITDLGTGLYLGTEGGLYLNGSNVMPASHDADGVTFAKAIQPLDANGNPDPNGKDVILSIGLSITNENFKYLITEAHADPTVNSHLVFVDGAQPLLTAGHWANTSDPAWNTITDYFLPQAGVTANQVVAVWIMTIIGDPTGTFPSDMDTLTSDYVSIAQNLHSKFPNLTLVFFSSRDYAGYSNGIKPPPADQEPYAYESGFAVRNVIADQLNGDPALNYNPASGPVMAPWLAWADYDWANGLSPRSDGLAWGCQDFLFDGTHNSIPVGRAKNSTLLLNFFKTDDATTPWFLAPVMAQPARKPVLKAKGGKAGKQ